MPKQYNRNKPILLVNSDMEDIEIGSVITDFRGQQGILEGTYPFDGKTGKVAVKGQMGLYYPSVYKLHFMDNPDYLGLSGR